MNSWQKHLFSFRAEAVSWIGAIVFLVSWTAWSSLKTFVAVAAAKPPTLQEVTTASEQGALEIKRRIQKHFLSFDVYLPLEDIVFVDGSNNLPQDLSVALKKACGPSKFVVWLPLGFRLPIFGEKVIEWCWSPTLPD
jgi:hypothetical protein